MVKCITPTSAHLLVLRDVPVMAAGLAAIEVSIGQGFKSHSCVIFYTYLIILQP